MENYIINIDSSLSNESVKKNIMINDFTFTLQNPVKNVVELKMSSIEIPNTSYLITKKKDNNYFLLSYNNSVSMIKITEGNFEPMDLKVIIEKELKKIDEYFEVELIQYLYKIRIYHSNKKIFGLKFKNNSIYNSLGGILGYEKDKYDDEFSYVAEKMIYIIDNNYCFLHVNNFGHIYHNNRKYLSKIIMTSKKYEMVFDGNHKYVSKNIIFKQPINIDVLNIKLEDFYGNLLELNSIPFSFTLELSVIKHSMLKRYKELTFYDPELMELILNDVMLTYFSKETGDLSIGKPYDNIIKSNVTNHVNKEDNEIDNQIKLIDNINNDVFSLMDVEEKDRKHNNQKKKKKLEKLIKKFKNKYPERYNKLKNDKKKLIKTVYFIVQKGRKSKKIAKMINY